MTHSLFPAAGVEHFKSMFLKMKGHPEDGDYHLGFGFFLIEAIL